VLHQDLKLRPNTTVTTRRQDKKRKEKKRKEKKIFVSDHEIQVANKRRDVLGVRTVSLASLSN